MKLLKELLKNVDVSEIIRSSEFGVRNANTSLDIKPQSLNFNIESISFDSRNIHKGTLFIAIKGTKTDGHNFINDAIKKGAIAIVCEIIPGKSEIHMANCEKEVTYIKVPDSNIALGYIASAFYDNPSAKLKLVGITGTNGKTTVATLLYNLFRKSGKKSGLISTVKYLIDETEVNATHTTPDAIQINHLLSRMVNEGCTHCFIEVSSHSVVQKRITGLTFAGGVFTNITHDHLDYHKTFDEYLKAKKTFFDNLGKEAFALSNIDDKNGNVILQNTKAVKKTYSLQKLSDFRAKLIQNDFSGMQINIDGTDVWCRLVGSFNAYNMLAIYATAILLDEEKSDILRILSDLNPVEGRFEIVRSSKLEPGSTNSSLNSITAIVDYAHTPDALMNVLKTIREIQKVKSEKQISKLITVVGCGGDRDRTKRPIMAKICFENSDTLILTSDNPRTEDPEQIITEMQKGIPEFGVPSSEFKDKPSNLLSIVNRKEAIKTACLLAKPGDIILVAGKGHETYQDINGVKYPFDDKKVLEEILNFKS